jgi:glyoxylase-like metal-dependent hydrolase (beta-lactamase superfamily II)
MPGFRRIVPCLLLTAVFAVTGPFVRAEEWQAVIPGVLRSPGPPHAYALVKGDAALLIGAPHAAALAGLKWQGVQRVELVLLTHHHRDSTGGAGEWVAAGVPVRAPRRSAEWLTPEAVRVFWKNAMPVETPGRFPPLFERFWGKWAYLVVPAGIEGVRCDLEDGARIDWRGWWVEAVATPGHSPDHFAFVARRTAPDGEGAAIAFCGDALCRPGKIWTPYTTDWHHVNPDGLTAAAAALRILADRKPAILLPEHGPPITENIGKALADTAAALDRAAGLKSFEHYTKERIGNPPQYAFLAPDQVGTANPQGNPKPWTRLSPHLYLTGNTFALASKSGPVLLLDPYAQNLPQRVAELRRDHGVGPVEAVLVSHAHNDHYTGIFALPDRERFKVWVLDRVAEVIADPRRYRAPYADARPVRVDCRLKDGETLAWREYRLRFHHLPGQTVYAEGVEVAVDGRKCLFTGDNFYHQDQYSGSGGWSGFNRGLPRGYAQSARRVLELQPDWVLAEHGGAFAFAAEDFRRRVRWAEDAGAATDALSPSGDHAHDWDPHRVRIEPVLCAAIPGRTLRVQVVAANPTGKKITYKVRFTRPDLVLGKGVELTVPPRSEARREVQLSVPATLGKGRHVVPCEVTADGAQDGSDTILVLDVE